ncbi:MAG TPA: MFS transporter [Candidatus Udaeobacter sp.]|jgi:MFS transporter, Spinster family, sphingosine-1-phosphate transporter|nr:MFS transporter [Candidatus Udaeobacter sp.]
MSTNSIKLSSSQIRLLAVLALINFVNFAARQVFVPLIPLLREHLHATDAQLGSLQTWLLVVLALASMPFGFFADRISRKAIIGVGIFFWSAATFAGGLVSSFVFFLIARALVGLGEAAYAPAAQSMISGAFPDERRALAQAIFASGMLLGGASGHALGGIIGPRYGWQAAFFIVAFAGVIPGLALFGIEEPPRGPRSDVVPIARLLRVPAFVCMIFAGICITFSSVSLLTWSTDFAVNYKDFSLREASVSLAIIGLLSALLGVLTGGFVADRLHRNFSYGRIMAIVAAFLLAAPFLLLAIQSEEKSIVLVGLSIAFFFMSWYHGPVTAVLHDMMPRRAHATSVGVYMFATQLLGGLGPHVVGKISDLRDLQLGLQIAVAVLVCGALLMLLVIHFIRRDGMKHPVLDAFHAEPGD